MVSPGPEVSKEITEREVQLESLVKRAKEATKVSKETWVKKVIADFLDPWDKQGSPVLKELKEVKVPEEKQVLLVRQEIKEKLDHQAFQATLEDQETRVTRVSKEVMVFLEQRENEAGMVQ